MQKLFTRALPVFAVICDVLLIYDLAKELVSDIKNYRKKKKTTTTKDETPNEPEPVTT